MKFKRKYVILLSIIGVALMMCFATSYGYFSSSILTNAKENVIESGTMSLQFDDGPQLLVENAKPGDSSTKTFSVTNTGTVQASYTLYLSEVLNLLVDKEDFVYSLTSSEASVNVENVTFPDTSTALVTDKIIDAGQTHNYELTIDYLSKDDIQNDNMNRSISAKITVNEYNFVGNNMPNDNSGVIVTQKVENVEALKAVNANVGDVIETQGYYSANDAGQAYYTIEENTSQTIDNGLYIALDNGNVAKLMSLDDSYNLKQFGAKGDGVSDDKTIIENAISKSMGKILFVPQGTYMISDTISITNFDNFSLVGEGNTSIFKATGNFAEKTAILYFTNSSNINIVGMTFDGNIEENSDSALSNSLVLLELTEKVNINKCTFQNSNTASVKTVNVTKNLVFANSEMSNAGGYAHGSNSQRVEEVYIEYNNFHDKTTATAISFAAHTTYTNINVNYNTISHYGPVFNGNKVYANCFLINLNIIGNVMDDISMGIYIKYGQYVTIKDNTINTTRSDEGIALRDSVNVEIDNNNISNTHMRGIWLDNASNVKAHDNTLTDCGKINMNYYFVDISSNTYKNIEFYNNTLVREDEDLYEVLMVVHGDGGVKIIDNTFTNGMLRLWTDSSNVYVSNSGSVMNSGTNNTIIN